MANGNGTEGLSVGLSGDFFPLDVVANDQLNIGLTSMRCSSCRFAGGEKLDWEANQHRCPAYKLAPDDRCFYETVMPAVPNIRTAKGVFEALVMMLGTALPALLLEHLQRKATGRDPEKATTRITKMIPAVKELVATIKSLQDFDKPEQRKETPGDDAATVLADYIASSGGRIQLPDGRVIEVVARGGTIDATPVGLEQRKTQDGGQGPDTQPGSGSS